MKQPARNRTDATEAALERVTGMPLYQQMVALLTNKIRSGAIAPGEYLPSENALCKEFGVSRITAKRAMNELAQAGLVARERGRGTRVLENQLSRVFSASIDGWRENVGMMGRRTSAHVLEFGYGPASSQVAEALEIETGETVQRAVRVRRLEGQPFSYLVSYVPEEIGRRFKRKDLGNKPLHKLLEQAGVKISAARQTLTATLADPSLAGLLEIPIGSPLIDVERIVRDAQRQPVEYIKVLYRPDLYRFEISMDHEESGAAGGATALES
ncbi:MAG: GntR family transcriptional regulator [Paracoccaceae bacterium]